MVPIHQKNRRDGSTRSTQNDMEKKRALDEFTPRILHVIPTIIITASHICAYSNDEISLPNPSKIYKTP